MAKPKTPLLSLEAHGSLADTLTYQGRGERKIARQKPRLPYFLTLPAQYQRWLYQDYAHGWRDQSAADQKAMRAAGVRFHLTGFQYWMKYNLTNLPDIMGMWYLDTNVGGSTPDASRNGYTGTIFGASPMDALIDRGLSFDGINDYVDCGNDPALRITDQDFSLEFFLTLKSAQWHGIITHGQRNNSGWTIYVMPNQQMLIQTSQAAVLQETRIGNVLPLLTPTHVTITRIGDRIRAYWAGVELGYAVVGVHIDPLPSTRPFYMAHNVFFGSFGDINLDHIIMRNRIITTTEMARHAARRWPHV